MKILRYILLGIMLTMLIPFCDSQVPANKKQVITLQCISEKPSDKLLSESRTILLNRLAAMKLKDVSITCNNKTSELVITVGDSISGSTLSELLVIQGHVYFYETLGRQEILTRFGNQPASCVEDALKSLHARDTINSRPESILGITDGRDTSSVNTCLTAGNVRALLYPRVRLLWSIYPVKADFYGLYCIASSDETCNEKDILEAHADLKNPDQPVLSITFKKNAWKSWDDATVRSLNKSIAFVIDNKVYSAPRILAEIPHGKISLTGGGFSKTEVMKLVSIISNGIVPLKFAVVSNN